MNRKIARRRFLFAIAGLTGGVFVAKANSNQPTSANSPTTKAAQSTTMPMRQLGNTGLTVPILGLGGAGKTPLSWDNHEADARAMIEKAWDLGIRYFDTAASYGPSEGYLGKVLPSYQKEALIATKTAKRDRDGAWRELERSLKRLNVETIDLWQLHHVSFPEELDTIFGANGAAQAMEEAKEQNLVRFSGITGHHEPDIIADALRRYPFDATLIPVNAAEKHHPRSFTKNLLPVAQKQGVAAIAMKVPAYGRLLQPGVLGGMHEALGYPLSQPGVSSAIVAAESPEQLEANVETARQFQTLTTAQLQDIESRTANNWETYTFFRSWT